MHWSRGAFPGSNEVAFVTESHQHNGTKGFQCGWLAAGEGAGVAGGGCAVVAWAPGGHTQHGTRQVITVKFSHPVLHLTLSETSRKLINLFVPRSSLWRRGDALICKGRLFL